MSGRRPRSRWVQPAAVVGACLTLAGCGGTSSGAMHAALAALATPIATARAGAAAPPAVSCGDRTASLRPPAALPAPGRMPARSYMATIEHQRRLIAGVDQNTSLVAYFNPHDGQIEGFEIDLLHQIAAAIFGNPNAIQFKALTTSERLPAVQSGAVAIVADAITITCYRRTLVDFSTVYYNAGERLLVPIGSPIHGLRDLGGRRVCATVGSTSLAAIESLRPAPIAVPVPERTDCLVALQQGRVDAIASDDTILLGFRAQDPYTKLVGPSFSPQPYGIAISKAHPDFVRFVNGVLERMRADGRLEAIYRKWLGPYETVPAAPVARYER